MLSALEDPQRTELSVAEMLDHYTKRRAEMVGTLEKTPGIHCVWPEGAFYAFADVAALYGAKKVTGSAEAAVKLRSEHPTRSMNRNSFFISPPK